MVRAGTISAGTVLVTLVAGCTASPAYKMAATPTEYVYMPASCVQICELQQRGRLPGICRERDYKRYRAMGMNCMVADPLRNRRALLPQAHE